MRILKYGSRGAAVQLLQLALNRAGEGGLALDGVFGDKTKRAVISFQRKCALAPDGIVGAKTHRALVPYYTGYVAHKIAAGDTLWALAERYGVTLQSILIANPLIQPEKLRIGATVNVPLGFDVVPTNITYSAALTAYCVRGLKARYPFLTLGELGKSVMGRSLWYLSLGEGENTVFYNAAHHANEWITIPVLLKFLEDYAKACAYKDKLFGYAAGDLYRRTKLYIAPCVNPDGVDLCVGELNSGEYYNAAVSIARDYPDIPFPAGWKANVRGVDLNLQYPAGWETARENKFAQGFISPAPSDFVGTAPLIAPEARAVYDFTLSVSPSLILAYHTQGEVIYWKYADFEPSYSRSIAETFSALSGYAVQNTPYSSGFAGFKDWFIQEFDRPGYTIEAGYGVNPLPISQFDKIYSDNLGILTYGMLVT